MAAVSSVSALDTFITLFIDKIDSGFGLIEGDVLFVARALLAVDLALAGLFWAWADDDPNGFFRHFVKKVLYIGAFTYIIQDYADLASVIYETFAQFGIKAGGSAIAGADLLKPGKIAAVGLDAGKPLMDYIGTFQGTWDVLANLHVIMFMMVIWFIVVLAFGIIAIQLFMCIVEFKVSTLCGFVLVPFAMWNKSSFLAEKVLGHVFSSGIKVLVIGLVIGIGSTIFKDITTTFTSSSTIGWNEAASLALAALTLTMLSIFAPSIASGIVSGGPQLGAGAAVGTAAAVGGAAYGAFAAGRGAFNMGSSAVSAAAKVGGATYGAASTGATMASATGGNAVMGAAKGLAGAAAQTVAKDVSNLATKATAGMSEAAAAGTSAAFKGTGGKVVGSGPASAASTAASAAQTPDWAKKHMNQQHAMQGAHVAASTMAHGDKGMNSQGPSLSSDDK